MKHVVHEHPRKNEIFQATPRQIKALRKALGWTQRDLGVFLNLYHKHRVCPTVSRWETNTRKPSYQNQTRMLNLVQMYQTEYLEALRD